MASKIEEKEVQAFFKALHMPVIICSLLLLVRLYETIFDKKLTLYSIYPRAIDGLFGIFTAPLIHSGWNHLISNITPMFFLLTLLYYFYNRVASTVLILSWVITGIFVWLLARPAYHVGASGVVYSLIGFVLWSGLFRRSSATIVLSLLILAVYTSYFAGFAAEEGVSWESHIIGAIVGMVLAFVLKNVKESTETHDEDLPRESTIRSPYFAKDTFEKTKYQRWLEAQRDDLML